MTTQRCMTDADYFAFKRRIGATSQSDLKAFADDPEAYSLGTAKDQSDAMKWGTLLDCLLLFPEQFAACIAVSPYDEFRTKEAKAWRDTHAGAGRTVVKKPQVLEAVVTIRKLVCNAEVCDALFGSRVELMRAAAEAPTFGDSELPLDPDTGELGPMLSAIREHRTFDAQIAVSCSVRDLPVAAKLDIVPWASSPWGGAILDLKATTTFTPRKYLRTFEQFRYHWQGALYLDAHNATSDTPRDTFAHLIVEQKTGRSVVRPIDPDELERGRREYQAAIASLLHCRETGRWPGPWAGVESLRCSRHYREFELLPGAEPL